MTTREFSDAFDTLLNSYNNQAQFGEAASKIGITLDEYEKSVFLTKAQEELIVSLYNGKNSHGDSFESTEELRRYLDNLIVTKVYSNREASTGTKVSNNSILFKLPDNIAFITMEQVTYEDDSLGCYNGSIAAVYPVTHDEYSRVKNNPFRGPTKYKVLRLDSGDGKVELVSKYKIGTYLLKYLSKPEPIILVDLPDGLTINKIGEKTECKVNDILHNTILENAVKLAIYSKSIGASK